MTFWQKLIGGLAVFGAVLLAVSLVLKWIVDSTPVFVDRLITAFAKLEASESLDASRSLNLLLLFTLIGLWASSWAVVEATKLIQALLRPLLHALGLETRQWQIGSEHKMHWLWITIPTGLVSIAACNLLAPM